MGICGDLWGSVGICGDCGDFLFWSLFVYLVVICMCLSQREKECPPPSHNNTSFDVLRDIFIRAYASVEVFVDS